MWKILAMAAIAAFQKFIGVIIEMLTKPYVLRLT
jgi:hypothetical protein